MTASFDTTYHAPVLVAEVVSYLHDAKSVLDGTLGGGGHTAALLDAGVQQVTGMDRDPDAIATARTRLERFEREGRFRAEQGNYADIDQLPTIRGATCDGVLLDLGISSHQVDAEHRGFTFREGAPLDMRMSASGVTAADILNQSDETQLTVVFRELGDEPRAARLAREIVRRRITVPFSTSDDLVRAIRGALGPRSGPSDFARLFQALRIAVNDELAGLERALPLLRDLLAESGVMAIIAYHSGEDRLVKHTFRDWSTECSCPPKQPLCTCRGFAYGSTLTRRAVVPAEEEVARNPRARSAKLRVWRKERS
ncbi:MAG TPA: 16S rRNA (cytosine(1402)-N(4))-methyltransferase RsmH [Gemmatimonadaceae bacterium]|nr:16S rRNA (cytosine(1402)-N(4))-methyltransferase RsmH [Gemmatimonadaceae bacterium]